MIVSSKKSVNFLIWLSLSILAVLFMTPIFLVALNSFKSRFYISQDPFSLPNKDTFVGLENYVKGLSSSGFFDAFLRSVFITVASVALIVICTAMISYFLVRVKNKFTKALYFSFVFSMIVPFQMVMFTETYVVGALNLDNVFGIVLVYLGFGSLHLDQLFFYAKSLPF